MSSEQYQSTSADPDSGERPVRALRPFIFYVIVAVVFISDQASKWLVLRTLHWGVSMPVIGSAFTLTLTENTGGAWGLLPNGNWLFVIFAAVAVVALLVAYHRMQRVDLLVGAAFSLALGGALGNLLDRIRYHYVVDFFHAQIIHWPVFNVADSAISLGIVLLVVHFLMPEKRTEPAPASLSPAGIEARE